MNVKCCPNCERTDIYKRVSSIQGREHKFKYKCMRCGIEFDEPKTKERRTNGNIAKHGLARQLWEADKDAV